jgi:hypothetical protein
VVELCWAASGEERARTKWGEITIRQEKVICLVAEERVAAWKSKPISAQKKTCNTDAVNTRRARKQTLLIYQQFPVRFLRNQMTSKSAKGKREHARRNYFIGEINASFVKPFCDSYVIKGDNIIPNFEDNCILVVL